MNSSPNTSHLKYFFGEGCPFTAKAEPHVNCLGELRRGVAIKSQLTKYNTISSPIYSLRYYLSDLFLSIQKDGEHAKIERLEVYKNSENQEKYMKYNLCLSVCLTDACAIFLV
jgi:hypothetical protein